MAVAVRAICDLLEAEGPCRSGEAPGKRPTLATNALHSSMDWRDMFHAGNLPTAQRLSYWYHFAGSSFNGWTFIILNLEFIYIRLQVPTETDFFLGASSVSVHECRISVFQCSAEEALSLPHPWFDMYFYDELEGLSPSLHKRRDLVYNKTCVLMAHFSSPCQS